jgi:hypothetical protein
MIAGQARLWLCTSLLLLASQLAVAFPIDGYEETGIRRLDYAARVASGEMPGPRLPAGALLGTDQVDTRLRGNAGTLPAMDQPLSEALAALLGEQAPDYGLALLDLTDPNTPVYAAHREDYRQNVGSVGKLVAAVGLFQALADAYPGDNIARQRVLRETYLEADRFSHSDHHKITLFDPVSGELQRRPMQDGDSATLYEYLDWTLSVSSNSAAAMVMRDAMMLRELGVDYPLAAAEVDGFFDGRSRPQLTALFQRTFWEPVSENGLSLSSLRQGSFFTRGGKQLVNGGGLSYATPRSLAQLVLLMEQGRLVDEWSSRTLKTLLYLTERRIRYASAPALNDAAVYFKSGSLYSCREEEGFRCGAYRGNVKNYMNSVAIVEDFSTTPALHYAVVVVSNVLRENAAVAHQSLAGRIHALMKARHQRLVQ